MTTVFIHALGDVPTPPLFGAIMQSAGESRGGGGGGGGGGAGGGGGDGTPLPDDWRRTLCGFTVLMAVSAGILAGRVAAIPHGDNMLRSFQKIQKSLKPVYVVHVHKLP